ncbi:MAG: thioredoxin-dependent thiol peroxidase [Patescibacteria group bacterium]
MKLKIGDKAPVFSPDQKGVWSLLYFYPKDDTPGCTKEACTLRDTYPEFKKLGMRVFGVSTDSGKSHDKFIQKYKLPFTLIPDEAKELVRVYGVWGKKKFMGREYMGTKRMSFLLNPKGKIAKIYEEVKPEKHAEEVLTDLKELMK